MILRKSLLIRSMSLQIRRNRRDIENVIAFSRGRMSDIMGFWFAIALSRGRMSDIMGLNLRSPFPEVE